MMDTPDDAIRLYPIELSEHSIVAILGALDRDQVAFGPDSPTATTAGITADDVRRQWHAHRDADEEVYGPVGGVAHLEWPAETTPWSDSTRRTLCGKLIDVDWRANADFEREHGYRLRLCYKCKAAAEENR